MTSITLPLRLSTIIAGRRTPDAGALYEARSEMYKLAAAKMKRTQTNACEVFACKRHGGHIVDLIEL